MATLKTPTWSSILEQHQRLPLVDHHAPRAGDVRDLVCTGADLQAVQRDFSTDCVKQFID